MSAMPSLLSPFPLFLQYRTIAHGVVPPLFGVDLPSGIALTVKSVPQCSWSSGQRKLTITNLRCILVIFNVKAMLP